MSKSKKIKISGFIAVILLANFLFFLNAPKVSAIAVQVSETKLTGVETKKGAADTAQNVWVKAWNKFTEITRPLALSKAFWAAARLALNTLAYDTATWIGSGGKGQKPIFVTEGWGTYLENIADNAAGSFIEKLGKEAGFGKFNLCEPDLNVKVKIGLGLVNYQQPKQPVCTFRKMVKNWDNSLTSKNFLKDFQNMFEPQSNDLGIALSLQSQFFENKEKQATIAKTELEAKRGWLDVTNIAGNLTGMPTVDMVNYQLYLQAGGQANMMTTFTNTMVDAVNIFLNQLATSLFKNLMSKLVSGSGGASSPYTGDYGGFLNADTAAVSGGVTAAKEQFKKIIEPQFNVRGDYDILAELTNCPDPNKAGPTNCVITEKFRQAIADKKTVGQAMKEGSLNPEGIFGYINGEAQPKYQDENYPYRSMKILRKFRIIPAGWEAAAGYFKWWPDKFDKTLKLKDLVGCFNLNDEFPGMDTPDDDWCRGLVDPNWVLKAPLNYCRREGPGPEIQSEEVTGENADSKLQISRNDNYCADEQGCIKENSDGSCKIYGYCTEEKRKWNFGADSCEPAYNTCQTFKNSEGQTESYLKNTLNFSDCSYDKVGCEKYKYTDDPTLYNTTTLAIDWKNATDNYYFDKDIKSCEKDVEGCHEFIRTEPGVGANLLPDSSFEEDEGTLTSGIINTADVFDGTKSLNLTSTLSRYSNAIPGFDIDGEAFTFSFYAKNCGSGNFGLKDSSDITIASSSFSSGENWARNQITHLYFTGNTLNNQINFYITPGSSGCLIDALKFERGDNATPYSDYGTKGKTFLKLAPEYLNCNGTNPPAECANYTKRCGPEDIGCNVYTSQTDETRIPAKALTQDFCPAECLGYDSFVQQETYFDNRINKYFIPKTAKTCSSASVGCEQFTNLDTVGQGAEATEYYINLKQCIKPDNTCSEFYTWEGSDENGYQLKVFELKQDGAGNPAVTEDDSAECNEVIYNLPATDPAYNPDCRQYYSRSGSISYHLYTHTITCSDNCHPYRLSDASAGPICKNNGLWEPQYNACLYNAIPGEGTKCSAKTSGCREYTGNKGANMKVIINNDFEGSSQSWEGIEGATAAVNNTASLVGKQSLLISGGTNKASTTLGYLLQKGKSYVLSFVIMPTTANATINAYLTNGIDTANFSTKTGLNNSWQFVKINLENLDHNVNQFEGIVIAGSSSYYIDSIKLTEIADRYYLIKDSWQTPESCDQDQNGSPAPHFMAGCDAYSDKDGKINNLHSFTKLCAENTGGCELMIDTHNTKDYGETTSGADTIPADSFAYIVYNQDKECKESDKGCARFGLEKSYDGNYFYNDAYLVNDPDKSTETICSAENVGCQEWGAENGNYYFKDPGDEVCEYKQKSTSTATSWYKKKMKRCDIDSNTTAAIPEPFCYASKDCALVVGNENKVCKANTDCGANNSCVNGQCRYSCLEDGADYDCPTEALKTFGQGGSLIKQPGDWSLDTAKWAGSCSAANSGCTELIDPLSSFSTNNIFNADFSQNTGGVGSFDGWNSSNEQKIINLEPNALYRLSGKDTAGTNRIIFSCTGDNIYLVDLSPTINSLDKIDARAFNYSLNGMGAHKLTDSVILDNIGATVKSKYFYFAPLNAYDCKVTVQNSRDGAEFELKKAITDYQLDKNINKEKCNGLVNKGEGCILFNERSITGMDKDKNLNAAKLYWDADKLALNQINAAPVAGDSELENDSNAVIKVEPDRDCNKWIACKSQMEVVDANGTKSTQCFDVGICKSFNSDGSCQYFDYLANGGELTTLPLQTSKFQNYTGYIVPISARISNVPYLGFQNSGAMEQVGEFAEMPNSNFENYDDSLIPSGYHGYSNYSLDNTQYSVIDNPISAQKEGVVYPLEGKSFLKLSSQVVLDSDAYDVQPNTVYSMSGYINAINIRGGKGHRTGSMLLVIPLDATGNSEIDGVKKVYNNLGSTWVQYNAGSGFYSRYSIGTVEQGAPWTELYGVFQTGPTTYKLKTQILSYDIDGLPSNLCCSSDNAKTNLCEGNVYVDDIQIKPLLHVNFNTIAGDIEVLTNQSCRLYPKTDSLSCDYFETSGKRIKGWPGYCMSYDMAPGSTNSCLVWWPGERAKADGIYEEGVSYQDKAPLYYCIQGSAIENLGKCISGKTCNLWNKDKKGVEAILEFKYSVPAIPGVNEIIIKETLDSGEHEAYEFFDVYGRPDTSSDWELMAFDIVNNGRNHISPIRNGGCGEGKITGWIGYDDLPYYALADYIPGGSGKAQFIFDIDKMTYTSIKQIKIVTNECLLNSADINLNKDISSAVSVNCQKIAKVVTATGQNKYWSARVYKGTDYKSICTVLNNSYFCDYNSDYPPFGSIVNPKPINNPTEWDGSTEIGRQPLTLMPPDKALQDPYQPRAGQIHNVEDLKRIFAQSYGIWEWNGNWTCKNNKDPKHGNGICEQDCPGGSCVAIDTTKKCQSLSPGQECVTDTSDPACSVCSPDPADSLYKCQTWNGTAFSYGSLCCPHSDDCQRLGECKGGVLPDMDCDPDNGNDCDRSSCITLEKDSGYKMTYGDWYPPDILCPIAPDTVSGGNFYSRPQYSPLTGQCTGNGVTGDCKGAFGTNDYCAVPPRAINLTVNTDTVKKSGVVNFKFNSFVDGQQLPLIMAKVDWQDGSTTTLTGVEMRDRRSSALPHSFFHAYDFWTIRARNPGACSGTSCTVTPRVIIQDNWGWCSGSLGRLICNNLQSGPSVTVTSE